MADVFTPEKRSQIMARITGRNTKPEIVVRKLIHALGYRFRLHCDTLPGTPDIVLPRLEKVVFVNGCFWHGHQGCARATVPTTNTKFWRKKIEGNIARDKRTVRKLRRQGWGVMVVWECQTRDLEKLSRRIGRFLESQ